MIHMMLIAIGTLLLHLAWSNTSLKIYLYDLPEFRRLHNDVVPLDPRHAQGDVSDSNYGLDQILPVLIKHSAYLTKNPEEADYFALDAWVFWPHATNKIEDIVKLVRSKGPWWDKKNGSDHIILLTADQGRCQYRNGSMLPVPELQNVIVLQHYGGTLHHTDFFSGVDHFVKSEAWGGDFDRQLILSELLLEDVHCKPNERKNVVCQTDRKGRSQPFFCHIQGQDIVVPPSITERPVNLDCHHCIGQNMGKALDMAWRIPYLDEKAAEIAKERGKIMLFHYGGGHLYEKSYYSVGARQTVSEMFGGERQAKYNFSVSDNSSGNEYFMSLLLSTFCLATTGTGWGGRLKVGLVRGCIPVIIHDGIYAEWEGNLPLWNYTIRLPSYMTYQLPTILQTYVSTGRAAKMQENLKCAWRLHWWRRPHGKAFEVLACELMRRKKGLKGPMQIDFQACTLTCIPGEPSINLLEHV